MRPGLLLIALLSCAAAHAQQQPASQALAREQLDPRQNQKIERIRVEDEGNRIDEVRVGGESRSITVQPKAGVPAYEIQPTDMARTRPGDHRDGMSAAQGRRVWNVFGF